MSVRSSVLRQSPCSPSIRREAEDELLVEYGFAEQVAPEDRARLQGEEGDESTE
jgi:hypothetical protein